MGNTSYTAHISNKKSAITSKSKLLGVAKHNLRKYKPDDYSKDNIIVLRGTDDLLQDVKNVYHQEFDEVIKELLKKYTNQAHDVGRIAIEYTDKRTVLNQLELSEGNNLINAGKVLFADDLIQDIQMAIFATNERLTFNDIQRHHGPVLKLVDIAENYIKSNIHWRVEFTGTLQRTEIPEIPVDAIREALLNSLIVSYRGGHIERNGEKTWTD